MDDETAGRGGTPAPTTPGTAADFRKTTVRAARTLTPAAQRALDEAEERRSAHATEKVDPASLAPERNGRAGPEPIRYGDWEKNGIISDF